MSVWPAGCSCRRKQHHEALVRHEDRRRRTTLLLLSETEERAQSSLILCIRINVRLSSYQLVVSPPVCELVSHCNVNACSLHGNVHRLWRQYPSDCAASALSPSRTASLVQYGRRVCPQTPTGSPPRPAPVSASAYWTRARRPVTTPSCPSFRVVLQPGGSHFGQVLVPRAGRRQQLWYPNLSNNMDVQIQPWDRHKCATSVSHMDALWLAVLCFIHI